MTASASVSTTTTAAAGWQLVKTHTTGASQVSALRGVCVSFHRAEFTAIMGPSGSGKSTLLHCLAGLDTVTSGTVLIGDVDITGLSRDRLAGLRARRLGFVFQSFNLIPILTAEENIRLTARLARLPVDEAWLQTLVRALGLEGRLQHRPAELSGGQQQRVAVARALLSRPEVLFADEPTGNLDSVAGREVLTFMRTAVDEHEQSVVMVTHDARAASFADRVLFLSDGQIVDELVRPTVDSVLAHMRALEG